MLFILLSFSCGLPDDNDSGNGGGGGGNTPNTPRQYCYTGYCYSYLEGICCPRSHQYACKGYCYNYSGGGGCYNYKTTCY